MRSKKAMFLGACIAVAAAVLCGGASAELTAAEAERLGKDLTPFGAEAAGNAAGTIPKWEGGLKSRPAGLDAGHPYADPYAAEKPLYTVTADNLKQYENLLSPGQRAMFQHFPDYRMNVYPSHRTAAFPQVVYDNIRAEAAGARLSPEGNAILGIDKTSVPFPVPKTGLEAIKNHITRYRGGTLRRFSSTFPVQVNGAFTAVERAEKIAWAYALRQSEPNMLYYYMREDTAPSSVAGSVVMVHEPIDQIKDPRQVWSYNSGSRRVQRAPELSFDTPGIGTDGLATSDDFDGYVGSPQRFDWKLVGKKEMLISYNNYRLMDRALSAGDVVKPGHLNQDLVRYELHRVWVVEASVRKDVRHIYSKRSFYLDEDSWQVAQSDMYDGRGELWRTHEMESVQFYDAPAIWVACDAEYDLQARRYLVASLVNERRPIVFNVPLSADDFTLDALRSAGQ